jgi:hypothetical protein
MKLDYYPFFIGLSLDFDAVASLDSDKLFNKLSARSVQKIRDMVSLMSVDDDEASFRLGLSGEKKFSIEYDMDKTSAILHFLDGENSLVRTLVAWTKEGVRSGWNYFSEEIGLPVLGCSIPETVPLCLSLVVPSPQRLKLTQSRRGELEAIATVEKCFAMALIERMSASNATDSTNDRAVFSQRSPH